MPNNRLTVFIKIKPYLKAFLISVFGEEPVFIPKNFDGLYINIFEKLLIKPNVRDIISIPDNKNDYIEIILPYYPNTNINVKNFLSANSQRIIEQRIADIFWETFYHYISDLLKHNISINGAIYSFMERYNLPFDSNIEDTLKKSHYRRKNKFLQVPTRQYVKKS